MKHKTPLWRDGSGWGSVYFVHSLPKHRSLEILRCIYFDTKDQNTNDDTQVRYRPLASRILISKQSTLLALAVQAKEVSCRRVGTVLYFQRN